MNSVKGRTQKEIIDYIRAHSEDGKLTKSLLEIAKDIGYSNATIHRALHALEESGLIGIEKSEKPNVPNTIYYKGARNEIDDFLAQGIKLSQNVDELGKQIHSFLEEATWLIRKLENSNSITDRIVHMQDVPNSDLQILTVRKE